MFFTDMEFLAQFKRAPAARTIHHAYIGGLLEHTWELVQLWEVICRIYPQVNKDLLLTGAILHDIGKIKEFEYRTYIDYTEEGELIGHIVISTDMILDKINAIEGFPDKLKLNIQHMILSHHGEYIWGSPKKPKTLEACILHHIDNLSAQSKRIIQSTGYCRGE
jgi:3'-5' exoribonuclease